MIDALPPQRHAHILRVLEERGQVRVADIAADLGVSDITVRRDLALLAERGELTKTHGGATRYPHTTGIEPGFAHNLGVAERAKAAIARAAAARVVPGSTIALNAGTTSFRLARELRSISPLTIVTNSPRVATVFDEVRDPGHTVILTGGVRTPSDALVGPFATATLSKLRVDTLFLGIHGASPEAGLTTPNLLEAEVNRALISSAASVVVIADHAKWGRTGLVQFAELGEVAVFITDEGLASEEIQILRDRVETVVIAPSPPVTTPQEPRETSTS